MAIAGRDETRWQTLVNSRPMFPTVRAQRKDQWILRISSICITIVWTFSSSFWVQYAALDTDIKSTPSPATKTEQPRSESPNTTAIPAFFSEAN